MSVGSTSPQDPHPRRLSERLARRAHRRIRWSDGRGESIRWHRRWIRLGMACVLLVLLVTTTVDGFRVAGTSMEGTLLVGDRILANKLLYGADIPLLPVRLPGLREVRPGDVIVFRHPDDPGRVLTKRCVAVGGDRWTLPDGVTIEVPPRMLYVLGDNTRVSSDSRAWGFVPEEDVIGRAELILWSRDDRDGGGGSVRWHRVGRRVPQRVTGAG